MAIYRHRSGNRNCAETYDSTFYKKLPGFKREAKKCIDEKKKKEKWKAPNANFHACLGSSASVTLLLPLTHITHFLSFNRLSYGAMVRNKKPTAPDRQRYKPPHAVVPSRRVAPEVIPALPVQNRGQKGPVDDTKEKKKHLLSKPRGSLSYQGRYLSYPEKYKTSILQPGNFRNRPEFTYVAGAKAFKCQCSAVARYGNDGPPTDRRWIDYSGVFD
ncbi:hypothetical protein NEUTE2DRAFT_141251 [Neurospora tetrasperma FGSC 2509]|nr:hypothetical protein NEUTE2DRAFT_141251 [Neurospora tetrasperma FGSC 2509]